MKTFISHMPPISNHIIVDCCLCTYNTLKLVNKYYVDISWILLWQRWGWLLDVLSVKSHPASRFFEWCIPGQNQNKRRYWYKQSNLPQQYSTIYTKSYEMWLSVAMHFILERYWCPIDCCVKVKRIRRFAAPTTRIAIQYAFHPSP